MTALGGCRAPARGLFRHQVLATLAVGALLAEEIVAEVKGGRGGSGRGGYVTFTAMCGAVVERGWSIQL